MNMNSKTLSFAFAAPAIVFLAACSMPVDAGIQSQTAGYSCQLTAQPSGRSVDVVAQITTTKNVQGSYLLSVGRMGGSNSAMIEQGGAFEAGAGETVTLGSIAMNGSDGLTGELTITANGETRLCPLTGPISAQK